MIVMAFALLFASSNLAQQDSQPVPVAPIQTSDNELVPTSLVEPPLPVLIDSTTPLPPVASPISPNPPGGSSGGGSTGGSGGSGSKKSDDDEGSRRVLNKLPLTNLSNTLSDKQNLEIEQSSGLSRITGAVIGVFGKRGTLGIGIFIVVLGVVGLLVYNRKRFGFVKVD